MDEKLKQIKEDLKMSITDFCRYKMHSENPCEEGDWEFCPMNCAYDMIVDEGEEEEYE